MNEQLCRLNTKTLTQSRDVLDGKSTTRADKVALWKVSSPVHTVCAIDINRVPTINTLFRLGVPCLNVVGICHHFPVPTMRLHCLQNCSQHSWLTVHGTNHIYTTVSPIPKLSFSAFNGEPDKIWQSVVDGSPSIIENT